MRQACHAGLEIVLIFYEERKRPMKSALNQHRVTLNAEHKLTARRKVINRPRLLMIFILVLATAVVAAAQSHDRDHPTPLTSDLIKGTGTGKKVEYFYSFTGGPGQVLSL
jgi:hypothetical protein